MANHSEMTQSVRASVSKEEHANAAMRTPPNSVTTISESGGSRHQFEHMTTPSVSSSQLSTRGFIETGGQWKLWHHENAMVLGLGSRHCYVGEMVDNQGHAYYIFGKDVHLLRYQGYVFSEMDARHHLLKSDLFSTAQQRSRALRAISVEGSALGRCYRELYRDSPQWLESAILFSDIRVMSSRFIRVLLSFAILMLNESSRSFAADFLFRDLDDQFLDMMKERLDNETIRKPHTISLLRHLLVSCDGPSDNVQESRKDRAQTPMEDAYCILELLVGSNAIIDESNILHFDLMMLNMGATEDEISFLGAFCHDLGLQGYNFCAGSSITLHLNSDQMRSITSTASWLKEHLPLLHNMGDIACLVWWARDKPIPYVLGQAIRPQAAYLASRISQQLSRAQVPLDLLGLVMLAYLQQRLFGPSILFSNTSCPLKVFGSMIERKTDSVPDWAPILDSLHRVLLKHGWSEELVHFVHAHTGRRWCFGEGLMDGLLEQYWFRRCAFGDDPLRVLSHVEAYEEIVDAARANLELIQA